MRTEIIQVVTITFLALTAFSSPACALERASLSGTDAGIVTLKAENSPLNELVRELTRKCGLDLKGSSLGSEGVYLDLTESPLEDVLKRLLRGYNYVLIKTDGSGRGSLIVFGKSARVALSYPPPSAVSAPPSGDTGSPVPATGQTAVASSAGQDFHESARRFSPSMATGQRGSGEASLSSFPAAAQADGTSAAGQSGGASGVTNQNTASPSRTGATSSGLTPPPPPQIAGHDLPPAIPSALLNGGAASQGGSGSAGSGAAAAGTGSASTSGGSSGNSSGSSGASGGNSPTAPPQIPVF
ncbi:MAG: hypothetical protein ABSC19_10235 [Syntrophorhabdales bacterium]|jgi:hypothetical protein